MKRVEMIERPVNGGSVSVKGSDRCVRNVFFQCERYLRDGWHGVGQRTGLKVVEQHNFARNKRYLLLAMRLLKFSSRVL